MFYVRPLSRSPVTAAFDLICFLGMLLCWEAFVPTGNSTCRMATVGPSSGVTILTHSFVSAALFVVIRSQRLLLQVLLQEACLVQPCCPDDVTAG